MSGELPPGWVEATFGELIHSAQNGFTGRGVVGERSMVVLRLADVEGYAFNLNETRQLGMSSKDGELYRLNKGDLVCIRVNGSSDIVGRLIFFDSDEACAFCDHFIRIKLKESEVNGKYISYYFRTRSARRHIESSFVSSAGQKTVSQSNLGRISIPLPPLPEQHRIVERIEALLAKGAKAKAALDTLPALLDRYRQSLLAAAFRGTEVSPMDWIESQEVTGRFPIRRGWEWKRLEEIISPDYPLCYGVVQPGEDNSDGTRLIRVCDLTDGRIMADGMRGISAEIDSQFKRSRVKQGDILVSLVGTIGRVAVVPDWPFVANIARALARVSPCKKAFGPMISAWLRTPIMQEWLNRQSREVARKTLNLGDLAKAPIPVPPEADVLELVQVIERNEVRVRELLMLIPSVLQQHTALTQSILAKAFRGELVPQDPADEPASVLLDRIRAERVAEVAKPRRRKREDA